MRARLSYANLVSTLALFVALGGTAYAVSQITGRQVVDRSLYAQDLHPSARAHVINSGNRSGFQSLSTMNRSATLRRLSTPRSGYLVVAHVTLENISSGTPSVRCGLWRGSSRVPYGDFYESLSPGQRKSFTLARPVSKGSIRLRCAVDENSSFDAVQAEAHALYALPGAR